MVRRKQIIVNSAKKERNITGIVYLCSIKSGTRAPPPASDAGEDARVPRCKAVK